MSGWAFKTHRHLRTMCSWNDSSSSDMPGNEGDTHNGIIGKETICEVVEDVEAKEISSHNHMDFFNGWKSVKHHGNDEMKPNTDVLSFLDEESAHDVSMTKQQTPVKQMDANNGDVDVTVNTVLSSTDAARQEVIFLEDESGTIEAGNSLILSQTVTPISSAVKQESLLNSEISAQDPSLPSGTLSPSVSLSKEQQHVFDLVVKYGRSVFLTGGAGTGKSHLLRAIIDTLPRCSTFVTATTGIAALNLGGSTLHSFAGCGIVDPQQHTAEDVYLTVRSKSKAKRNWRFCKVLVVDEVSMMDAWFLDVLEYVARVIRGSRLPFGGIQVVFAGDFLQLPPVVKQQGQEQRFCFEAAAWCRINPLVCVLSEHFRQKDKMFFAMLNEIRRGVLNAPSLALLTSFSSKTSSFVRQETKYVKTESVNGLALRHSLDKNDTVNGQEHLEDFSILRARRAEVDAMNTKRFNELTSEIFSYQGFHRGEGKYPADLPSVVSLRVGCRVMLLKNLDVSLGFVNGSIGTVESFINARKVCDFANKTTPADLRILAAHSSLPVVRFDIFGEGANKKGATGRLVMIEPHRWPVMQGDKEVSCSVQLPLQLAYAITIHKSQGMSLSRVNVDFKGIFEEGQAYVALSRCTDMNSLVIENFDAHRVNPNAKALAYYKALEEATDTVKQEEKELLCADTRYPWGSRNIDADCDVEGDCNTNTCVKENSQKNGAEVVEDIRRRITPFFVRWSSLRLRVLSATLHASSVHGALLVMDTSSLLALGSSPDFVDLYKKVFIMQQNMMRVPRVVKEELLRTATMHEVEVRMTPTVCLSFNSLDYELSPTTGTHEAVELAGGTLCIMEDAKNDFVLDEQRDGESRALPPLLSQWEEELPHYVWCGGEWGGTCSSHDNHDYKNSILEFTCYLIEQYSSHQEVLVCTESIELAARALSVGFRVCSLAYLCPK